VALVARYELCRERIKKLLLNKGFSPAAAAAVEVDHSPDGSNNEPHKPRKVSRVGPGRDLSRAKAYVWSGNRSIWIVADVAGF